MKFKTLFAAVAVALAAPAFATIANGDSGNGELFLVVQDSTSKVSFTYDLGIDMNTFLVSGQADTGRSLPFNIAADANWTTFQGLSTGNKKWSVMAIDSSGGQLGTRVITTVFNDPNKTTAQIETLMKTSTNTKLNSGAANVSAGKFFNAVNVTGTHRTATNGSSVNAEADGFSYFGKTGGLTDKLNNNLTFFTSNALGASSNFYLLNASSAAPGGFISINDFANQKNVGMWSFDGISLNYNLAAVPEAETYALMLAGLGAVGFLVRRRRV